MPFPVWIVGFEKFNVFHTLDGWQLRFSSRRHRLRRGFCAKSAAPNGTLPAQVVTNKSQHLKDARNTQNDISNKK
jgi:hypothetical protein